MEGREAMAMSGSNSYYMHRVSNTVTGTQTGGLAPPGFRSLSNTGVQVQSSGYGSSSAPTFQMEQPSQASFTHNMNIGAPSGGALSDPVKKKRGRPRKYAPDGAMSLGLSPMSNKDSSGTITPSPTRVRGRPRGSGRKQRLADLGEWMNSSAGLAFAPHVISIPAGEDVASKILLFSQRRQRAVCVMSGTGILSAVSLRQPASSDRIVTYEGHFHIVCLSGSYLLAEDGGPRDRTGGLNISVSSPEGHVIGGVVGGVLTAATPVQVVVCSFVYGGSKTKTEASPQGEKSGQQEGESATPKCVTPAQGSQPPSSTWPSSQPLDSKNNHTGIDLTCG